MALREMPDGTWISNVGVRAIRADEKHGSKSVFVYYAPNVGGGFQIVQDSTPDEVADALNEVPNDR